MQYVFYDSFNRFHLMCYYYGMQLALQTCVYYFNYIFYLSDIQTRCKMINVYNWYCPHQFLWWNVNLASIQFKWFQVDILIPGIAFTWSKEMNIRVCCTSVNPVISIASKYKISTQENAFENVICKMAAILFRPWFVNTGILNKCCCH